MKKKTPIVLLLSAVSCAAQADITLDGVNGAGDVYTNTESVSWFNGHRTDDSIYGDFNNQAGLTNIHYGVSSLAGESAGLQYFFLHVEVPLYAKNMIWEDTDWSNALSNMDPNSGLTESDVASYRTHHETHHNPFTMNLDFNGATGSEKVIFLNSNGGDEFKADLDGNADNAFGLLDFKDSVDYLLDNNLATEDLSLNRNTTMSFEFMFALDSGLNEEILSYVRNGIEFHLSPERGLPVPAPASLAFLGLGSLTLTKRRRLSN